MPAPSRPQAAEPAETQLGDMLCFAVYSAGLAFNRLYKPLLDQLDLTYPQYLVMLALWEQDGQTVGGLGEKLYLESSTLTPLLKRLEGNGYVRRVRNPDDERQVQIFLTEAGRALKLPATACPATTLQALQRSPDELLALKREVETLRDTLNAFIAARS
ncbi:MarR family transcriptional regulator [Ferrovibrio sp.]|uniref:MarR family winged helix-turn-helix transcriptional regulator n=1 Tax=Ferrovibrio sp. TaxID=1917215 RepID=UPI002601C4FB|nr:MarR family transcriptional regulator [Ferrovibrio sp.]